MCYLGAKQSVSATLCVQAVQNGLGLAPFAFSVGLDINCGTGPFFPTLNLLIPVLQLSVGQPVLDIIHFFLSLVLLLCLLMMPKPGESDVGLVSAAQDQLLCLLVNQCTLGCYINTTDFKNVNFPRLRHLVCKMWHQ